MILLNFERILCSYIKEKKNNKKIFDSNTNKSFCYKIKLKKIYILFIIHCITSYY